MSSCDCRCGESIDRGLVKNLLRMLVDLQLYQEVFELEFLRETEGVYHAEALRMMRDTEFTVSQLHVSMATVSHIHMGVHTHTHTVAP